MNAIVRNIQIHPDYQKFKTEILSAIDNFDKQGDVVFEGGRNHIKKFKIGDEYFSVKSFKSPSWFNAFVYKYIRKSKAKRSFEYALKLISSQISTPFPIAYVEEFSTFGIKKSYFVSLHIAYDFDFRVLIHNPNYPEREEILKQFTEFTFKLHENQINFLDHSPGNTLIVKKKEGVYDFYLIDLNRMVFEPLDFVKRMKNFRRLWLSKAMVKIMAKHYAMLSNANVKETHDLMLEFSRKFQRKVDQKKLRKSGRKMQFKS
ncbi:lipopolysaccharide kinase [Mariniflexile sp.]|uniref:lipopolysaccharide kinase n=1 Tax=Mariniflexile sp. TaxID=1979402 RepID=UPI003562ABFD